MKRRRKKKTFLEQHDTTASIEKKQIFQEKLDMYCIIVTLSSLVISGECNAKMEIPCQVYH